MAPNASPTPLPAFVHVDLDNLWAVAECYGIELPPSLFDFIYEDALPRLGRLFQLARVRATLFVVGRDLASSGNVEILSSLKARGHRLANHSQNHLLNFRNLSEEELEREVAESEEAIIRAFGDRPVGFRAPGYGISPQLLSILARRGYQYDSSAMPGPYGAVFRYLDARLRATTPFGPDVAGKTQYSRISDMKRHPLRPHRVESGKLLELPAATSPLLRLPFQAGVCLRLGRRYFDQHLAAFRRRPDLPLLFLLHAADVADFAALKHPFFQSSSFFSAPVMDKEAGISYFLKRIAEAYPLALTEEWITGEQGGRGFPGSAGVSLGSVDGNREVRPWQGS